MTPLFTVAELQALLGRTLTAEQFQMAYDLTEDVILGEAGSRLTDPPQRGVKSVALAVAARSLTNPGGVRSEQAGAIAVSYTDALTGAVLTDGELRRLRRAVGMASGAGMLTIAPVELGKYADGRVIW